MIKGTSRWIPMGVLGLALLGCSQSSSATAAGEVIVQKAPLSPSPSSPGDSRGAVATPGEDPYLWLEEIEGRQALDWVEVENGRSEARLKQHPLFDRFYSDTLEILNSRERIAMPSVRGGYVYNFWQDEEHVRGLWRRTSLASYKAAEPDWETLIDVDALAQAEGESWVYKGVRCLAPSYHKCLLSLSRGGKDAAVVREFHVDTKRFISDGFTLPEAKGSHEWLSETAIFIATDFGPGSMTKSGYPRMVKLWQRDTPLSEAVSVFTGNEEDVSVGTMVIEDGEAIHHIVHQNLSFYTQRLFAFIDGRLVRLDLPEDAELVGIFAGQALVRLKSDWQPETNAPHFAQGALVSLPYAELLAGRKKVQLVYEPDSHTSIAGLDRTKAGLVLNLYRDVQNVLLLYSWDGALARWQSKPLATPLHGSLAVVGAHQESDDFWFVFESFLEPMSLYFVEASSNAAVRVQATPSFFDEEPYTLEQRWSTSADGTKIPYYLVHRRSLQLDGKNPTLLYGYGGFEVVMDPYYLGAWGRSWLAEGGVFVLANIRGGGEFGPRWHQAALLKNRPKAFEDFISVAEELTTAGITSAKRLAIMGGSNGGLLVGASMVLRPELFGAVLCQVPLLDMGRYHKLLAGNSWMAEYGDPDDPDLWKVIRTYSPYHNLRLGVTYPEVFFTTSTKDDRVHPGHARKMAAKMLAMGAAVTYYENREGGHAAAADNRQSAYRKALEFAFLWQSLGM